MNRLLKYHVLLMALLLSGISATGQAGNDAGLLVIIKDYQFIPPQVTIKKGQTLVWENQEKRQYHSVWFEAPGEEEPDYFFPEEIYQRQFNQTGSFPYRCGPHPEMIGTVIVTD
jgi:plastocyanin